MKTGTEGVGLDHNHIIRDTTAKVTVIPTEAIPGHSTGATDDIIGVDHDAHIQVLIHILLAMTLHTAHYLHLLKRLQQIMLLIHLQTSYENLTPVFLAIPKTTK